MPPHPRKVRTITLGVRGMSLISAGQVGAGRYPPPLTTPHCLLQGDDRLNLSIDSRET